MPIRTTPAAVAAILLGLCFAGVCPAGPPGEICGRLSTHENIPVLELWGTPEEAAYAHGYLLAEEIVALFDGYVLDPRIMRRVEHYEYVLLPSIRRQFRWDAPAIAELDAMADGIRDRLGPGMALSRRLNRELGRDDLLVANAVSDCFGMMCSTFSVWGEMTRSGEVLTGRNLDYPSTPAMLRGQIVIAYRAAGGGRSWMGVSWPGLIGVYTAMNRDGVSMLIHDVRGLPPATVAGGVPRSLVLRTALEAAGPDSWLNDVNSVFTRTPVLVGSNIHVSGPITGQQPPAAVFEYDANKASDGVTIRLPNTGPVAMKSAVWCTNHFCERSAPRDCDRFESLQKSLFQFEREKRKLDLQGAFELVRSVRRSDTVLTTIMRPGDRSMYVYLPLLNDKLVEFRAERWLERETVVGGDAPGNAGAGVSGGSGSPR